MLSQYEDLKRAEACAERYARQNTYVKKYESFATELERESFFAVKFDEHVRLYKKVFALK
jgi:hypothetical protein